MASRVNIHPENAAAIQDKHRTALATRRGIRREDDDNDEKNSQFRQRRSRPENYHPRA